MDSTDRFPTLFRALTGHHPFVWQTRLYHRLVHGEIPEICQIPTGMGKTSVLPIWLIALATATQHNSTDVYVPRRLVYVVNRRTVVDQATEEALAIREKLLQRDKNPLEDREHLQMLWQKLMGITALGKEMPVAVSTLRGELADNSEWKLDPSRPAMIIGTVDMIGSKLLFSGYGDSFRMKPFHAGLLGQDTLLAHDEAHLTPAFGALLQGIVQYQSRTQTPRPLRVLELTATSREIHASTNRFELQQEDEHDQQVRQRLYASKSLFLHECNKDELIDEIVTRALAHETSGVKVLIYVRSPEHAAGLGKKLQKQLGSSASTRISLLTGTLRGFERDRMVREDAVFRSFLPNGEAREKTVYLVSTSAGEVGVNLNADHMVCDLTTLESMIQRFGRVNRFGLGQARIDVISASDQQNQKSKEKEPSHIADTRELLGLLPRKEDGGYDASPHAFRMLAAMEPERFARAFSPLPEVLPLDIFALDAWSLTTIRKPFPGRPHVAPWLHGITREIPETYVAWRAELPALLEANTSTEVLSQLYEVYPIHSREKLRVRTDQACKFLKALAKQHPDTKVVLIGDEVETDTLAELTKAGAERLAYRTLLLPTSLGGLSQHGSLDGNCRDHVKDVADQPDPAKRSRFRARLKQQDDIWQVAPLEHTEAEPPDWMSTLPSLQEESIDELLQQIARLSGMVCLHLVPLGNEDSAGFSGNDESEGAQQYLAFLTQAKQVDTALLTSFAASGEQELTEHLHAVQRVVQQIAARLALPSDIIEVMGLAGAWHDRGKDRFAWQMAIGNTTETKALAKSGNGRFKHALCRGYRHEFGSLLEARAEPDLCVHPEQELLFHLIAAHHGRARPHFPESAYDRTHSLQENKNEACQVPLRFDRLQRRFGYWGLAWLEALLRAADAFASQYPNATPEDGKGGA